MIKGSLKAVSGAVMLLAAGCGIATNSDKFDWKATESAPKNFPIKIIDGTFIYHGRSDGTGLYVPSGGLLDKGWGEMISSQIVGPDLKPLPDRLKITFFSYLEDQFYEGVFDLPYETILSLFKEQRTNGGPEYHRSMVGVAPGGYVAVWLKGHIKSTEVFFGRAEPVEGELKAFGRVIPNRSEYVLSEGEDNVDPSVLRRSRQERIPLDPRASCLQRYHWKPVFMYGNEPASGVQIKYFNGEGERLFPPLESELVTQTRAIPMFMQFSYRSPEGWAYLYVIHFDETEMIDAFSTLGSNEDPLQLEFYPHMPYEDTQIRLSNKDESIILKKFTIKDL